MENVQIWNLDADFDFSRKFQDLLAPVRQWVRPCYPSSKLHIWVHHMPLQRNSILIPFSGLFGVCFFFTKILTLRRFTRSKFKLKVFCQVLPRLNKRADFGGLVKAFRTLKLKQKTLLYYIYRSAIYGRVENSTLLFFFFPLGFLLDLEFLHIRLIFSFDDIFASMFFDKFFDDIVYYSVPKGPLSTLNFLCIKFIIGAFEDTKKSSRNV